MISHCKSIGIRSVFHSRKMNKVDRRSYLKKKFPIASPILIDLMASATAGFVELERRMLESWILQQLPVCMLI